MRHRAGQKDISSLALEALSTYLGVVSVSIAEVTINSARPLYGSQYSVTTGMLMRDLEHGESFPVAEETGGEAWASCVLLCELLRIS